MTDAIIYATVAGFASLVGLQVHAMWREARTRRWDLEDRAMARRERQFDPGPPPPGGTIAVTPHRAPQAPPAPPAPQRRGMSLRGPLAR